MDVPPVSVTADLVRRARLVAFDDLPADVVLVAKTCVLDWLGCALAGSREPLTEILAAEAATHGPASLIGRDATTSVHWAALVNGAASHALDYDDTHLVFMGHPTAPVLPALLALAEREGSSGRALIASFVSGVETECRLAAAIGIGHYLAGWHSTATLGTFGSAAACAHLLDLPEDAWAHAFGVAGVQAAGLKSVFGSMSKPFQAGKASANGLLAATLAGRGFTSATDIVETHQGFAATHAGKIDAEALEETSDHYLVRDTVFKYHASCYLTHSAIEAVLSLRDRHKFDAADVVRAEVVVPRGHLDVCNITEPQTGLEGKFSLRATAAMAMRGEDTADPASFTDERMLARGSVDARDKVTVRASEEVAGTQTRVEVGLADGRTLTDTFDVGIPADDLERQWTKLTQKFVRLSSPVLGEERAWQLHDRVASLEQLPDASELPASCRVAT